jgi:hypothetical protein
VIHVSGVEALGELPVGSVIRGRGTALGCVYERQSENRWYATGYDLDFFGVESVGDGPFDVLWLPGVSDR